MTLGKIEEGVSVTLGKVGEEGNQVLSSNPSGCTGLVVAAGSAGQLG